VIAIWPQRHHPKPWTPPSRPRPPAPPPPQPPELIVRLDGEISEDDPGALREKPSEAIRPPWAVLGYAVGRWSADGPPVLTHTGLMPYSEAQREADAQRRADQHGYSWAVVEVRSAS
jgi:hypothetical protein